MILDPYKKTVSIPVKWSNNQITFFYGGPVPAISDGTIGELVVPVFSVIDEFKLGLLQHEFTKKVFDKGTKLIARLSRRCVDNEKKLFGNLKIFPPQEGRFAEIRLESELSVKVRGTKKPEFLDCECSIPTLPEVVASSLNHAFTLISEHFEVHRKSHTGNVYEQVYYQKNPGTEWLQLEQCRDEVMREYEYEMFCLCKPWWTKNSTGDEIVWACCDERAKNRFIVYVISGSSEVVSENYFFEEKDAIKFLRQYNFFQFDYSKVKGGLVPPRPPYTKHGEVVKLTWHGKGTLW